MSLTAAALRKLAALNLSPDQMAGVLDILADAAQAEEERKAAQRDRARKHRAKRDGNVTDTLQSCDTVSPKKETSPTPPKEKTTPSNFSVGARDFDAFWSLFPNKVGKRDAEASFAKARGRADLETILAGVRRYAAKTDDRPWCNPSTFLNQNRWDDQPAAVPQRATAPPKGRSIGDVFRDDAKRMGLIDDEPNHDPGCLEASNGSRESGGSGIARRFAVPADQFGRIG